MANPGTHPCPGDEVFTAGLRGSKQMRAQIGGTKSIPWRR